MYNTQAGTAYTFISANVTSQLLREKIEFWNCITTKNLENNWEQFFHEFETPFKWAECVSDLHHMVHKAEGH